MVPGQEKNEGKGADDWDAGCFDESDNISCLSEASKIKLTLHSRGWQGFNNQSKQSRSIQETLNSARSQLTYRAEPCASEATVTLEHLPLRQLARAARQKRPVSWQDQQTTAHEDEQASVQRTSQLQIPGSAEYDDSSDEEYDSRRTKVKDQPVKRPRQSNQGHQYYSTAPVSHMPGEPTRERQSGSAAVWPAEHSPRLRKHLVAQQGAQGVDTGLETYAAPFHPLPHDLDIEE